MNIKLTSNKVIFEDVLPKIVDLSSGELEFKITNFDKLKGNLILRISYEGGHKDINIDSCIFTVPAYILAKNIDKIYFTLSNGNNTSIYNANVDKFKVKGITNINNGDKLLDLLSLLYNKYLELEKKYEKLDNLINQGDLLI